MLVLFLIYDYKAELSEIITTISRVCFTESGNVDFAPKEFKYRTQCDLA